VNSRTSFWNTTATTLTHSLALLHALFLCRELLHESLTHVLQMFMRRLPNQSIYEAVGLRVDRAVGRLPDTKTSGFGFDHDLSEKR